MQEKNQIKQVHVSAALIFRERPVVSIQPSAYSTIGAGTSSRREVFATARGYGDYKGWWEFPGGKIEHDEAGKEIESPEECLVREIREELDSEIRVEEKIATVEWDYPDGPTSKGAVPKVRSSPNYFKFTSEFKSAKI